MATHVLAISSHRFAVPVLPVVAVLAAVPLGTGLRSILTARRPLAIGVLALLAAWTVASQFVRLPGTYSRPVSELDGDRITYVTDPASGRSAILASAAGGRRLAALDTTEHFPQGFIVVVVDLKAGPLPDAARDDLEVASIIVSDEAGRRLCGAAVAARWFRPGGYQRVPARCELPPSGVVSIGVFTSGATDLWLDNYSVRFDIPTIEGAVIPDAGPRRGPT
jgi:hypothetical protein